MFANQQIMPRRSNFGVFFIFLLVGLFFLNASFGFYPLPVTLTANKMYLQVLNFVAGLFIIIGGFKFLSLRRGMY